MTVSIGMYEKSHAIIGERLAKLGLDVKVVTFDKSSTFLVDGRRVAPAEMDLDYMWLQSAINIDNFQKGAFDLSLACRSIKVLQTFNAGLDHPFYKQLSLKGTRICNSSAQAVAISEYVFGQLLSVLQPIPEQRAMQARKEWKITPYREIAGQKWLIVGYGPIGQEVAKRAKAFGATTAVLRRSPAPHPHADSMGTLADLHSRAAEADVVVLACPLNAATRGMAGPEFFARVKKGAILVNIARGGLVDDAAMLAALDSGHLDTAILDVFHEEPLPAENALWAHPKIRMTSHTSFAGSGVGGRWQALFLDNIQRFVRGEALVNEVRPSDLA